MHHLQRGWAIVGGCILAGGGLAFVASSQMRAEQSAVVVQANANDTVAAVEGRNSSAANVITPASESVDEGSGDKEYFEAYRRIPVTKDWLVGKWGSPECESDGIVVFERDGHYHDGGARGRYRVENGRITYSERVLFDLASDTEDRSQIDNFIVSRIERAGPDSFIEDGETVWDRCPSDR